MRYALPRLVCLPVICAVAAVAPAQAQTPSQTPAQTQAPAAGAIPVELNKLEPLTQGGPGCRVYFVASNPDTRALDQFRLDLILFGTDGVIARRVAFDLGPLPPHKTAVRLFDLAGQNCDDISRVLVNDVLACREAGDTAELDHAACLDRVTVSARTKARLEK